MAVPKRRTSHARQGKRRSHLHLKPIQIHPAKHNSCARGRRHDPKMHRSPAMQTYALAVSRHPNCLFEGQVTLYEQITPVYKLKLLYFCNDSWPVKDYFFLRLKSSLGVAKSESWR